MPIKNLLIAPALLAAPFVAACNTVPANHSANPTANFFAVEEGMVYRGARPSYQGIEELAGMSVRTIVNLENDDDAIKQEQAWAQSLGIKEVVAQMTGTSEPNSDTVTRALDTLADTSNMPIFVHCAKGQDRTGAIVALHRIFNQGWDAQDAKDEMEAHGYDNALLAMKEFVEKKAGLD
jgi:protein tyrosine/serine phosphatase